MPVRAELTGRALSTTLRIRGQCALRYRLFAVGEFRMIEAGVYVERCHDKAIVAGIYHAPDGRGFPILSAWALKRAYGPPLLLRMVEAGQLGKGRGVSRTEVYEHLAPQA